jgi:hypothetical protein
MAIKDKVKVEILSRNGKTELKVAKVANILRLTNTDFTRNMKGK